MHSPLVIKPHPISRGYISAAFLGASLWILTTAPSQWRSAAALGCLSLITGLRGVRGSVVISSKAVIVCGLIWSRTISREAVTLVDEDGIFAPTIEWTSHRGTKRSTPLMFLADSSKVLGPVGARNRRCTQELAEHLGSRRSRRR